MLTQQQPHRETVSRVSSLNFSSIDNDGELLVCPCSGAYSKQLPSLFPLLAKRWMHWKWTGPEGSILGHHGARWRQFPQLLRPWGWFLGFGCTMGTRPQQSTLPWHWRTTRFGPRWLAELPIALIWWTTATTPWPTALACNNGRGWIPSRLSKNGWAGARTHSYGTLWTISVPENPQEEVFFGRGCSQFCVFLLFLVCLVVSTCSCHLTWPTEFGR